MVFKTLEGVLHPNLTITLPPAGVPSHSVRVLVTLLEPDESADLAELGDYDEQLCDYEERLAARRHPMAVMRGEVWTADLSPTRGTEQSGTRPVLVVQTDRANPYSPHTIVVPFTTRIRQRLLPSHVQVLAGEGGLTQDSVALCEQIRVTDLGRLLRKLGDLTPMRMVEVNDALRAILSL